MIIIFFINLVNYYPIHGLDLVADYQVRYIRQVIINAPNYWIYHMIICNQFKMIILYMKKLPAYFNY